MKSTIKLVLVVCLFSSVAFADGEMSNGGKSCPTGTTCLYTTQPTDKELTQNESTDSALDFVREYLNSMLKYFEN
jgi:hypothetical protein